MSYKDFDFTIPYDPEDAMMIRTIRFYKRTIADRDAEITELNNMIESYGDLARNHMEIIRGRDAEIARLRNGIAAAEYERGVALERADGHHLHCEQLRTSYDSMLNTAQRYSYLQHQAEREYFEFYQQHGQDIAQLVEQKSRNEQARRVERIQAAQGYRCLEEELKEVRSSAIDFSERLEKAECENESLTRRIAQLEAQKGWCECGDFERENLERRLCVGPCDCAFEQSLCRSLTESEQTSAETSDDDDEPACFTPSDSVLTEASESSEDSDGDADKESEKPKSRFCTWPRTACCCSSQFQILALDALCEETLVTDGDDSNGEEDSSNEDEDSGYEAGDEDDFFYVRQ